MKRSKNKLVQKRKNISLREPYRVRREGLAEGKEEGRNIGIAEGRLEGMERLNCLFKMLLKDGRNDDLRRATEDEAYRDKLFDEYEV